MSLMPLHLLQQIINATSVAINPANETTPITYAAENVISGKSKKIIMIGMG